MEQILTPVPPRSSFVTMVAWIFIVLAGFSTFIATLQNVVLAFIFPAMEEAMRSEQPEEFPPLARFVFTHFRLLAAIHLGLSATTLISAIGLLKRKNWARLVFIGILVVGVIFNIGGLFLQNGMIPSAPLNAPGGSSDLFQTIVTVIRVFSAIVALAISVLFAWLIMRLVSAQVRTEFSGKGV